MESRFRLLMFALAAVFALAWMGVRLTQREVSGDPVPPRSYPPWTVHGIRIGASVDAVTLALGPPSKESGSAGQRTVFWERPEVSATFDAEGRAIDIYGRYLHTLDGATILWVGASESDVLHALGQGRTEKHYRPTGSGVISFGRTQTGTTHNYTDDTSLYSIDVHEDAVTGVRITPRPR